MKKISLVIPAKDEEKTLKDVCLAALDVLSRSKCDFHIILVNDGSRDSTGRIAEELRQLRPDRIRVIHHPVSAGLGSAYRSALELIDDGFVTWIPADGEIDASSLSELVAQADENRVIATYPSGGLRARSPGRVILSWLFQRGLNVLFANRIRYFNGNSLYPVSLVKKLRVDSRGFFFNAELLLRALRLRPEVRQTHFSLRGRGAGKSKAMSFHNFADVILASARLRMSLWRQ